MILATFKCMIQCGDKSEEAETLICKSTEDLNEVYRLDCLANNPLPPKSKILADSALHRLNLALFSCEVKAIANGRKILTANEASTMLKSDANTRRGSVIGKLASKSNTESGYELSKLKKTSSNLGSVLEGLSRMSSSENIEQPGHTTTSRPSVAAPFHPLQASNSVQANKMASLAQKIQSHERYIPI